MELDVEHDDFLVTEFGMGDSLPELTANDIANIHLDDDPAPTATEPDHDLQVEQDMHNVVEVLLCLNKAAADVDNLQFRQRRTQSRRYASGHNNDKYDSRDDAESPAEATTAKEIDLTLTSDDDNDNAGHQPT